MKNHLTFMLGSQGVNRFSQETIINVINCTGCNVTGNHSQVSNITRTSQYLCIQLQLWNDSQEKTNNKIRAYLARTALNIDV